MDPLVVVTSGISRLFHTGTALNISTVPVYVTSRYFFKALKAFFRDNLLLI